MVKGCGQVIELFYSDILYRINCGDVNPISEERVFCSICEEGLKG